MVEARNMKYEGFVSIANYMCCTKFCSIVANRFTCLLFVENWYIYSFKVHLPHGAVVTIANGKGKRPQFINIWLKASPADYQQTEGKGLDYFYSIAHNELVLYINYRDTLWFQDVKFCLFLFFNAFIVLFLKSYATNCKVKSQLSFDSFKRRNWIWEIDRN